MQLKLIKTGLSCDKAKARVFAVETGGRTPIKEGGWLHACLSKLRKGLEL